MQKDFLSEILAPRLDRIHVLVAEDDKMTAKIVHDVLERLGFKRVTAVRNGQEALEVMATESVDLVICDWRMKPVDGAEFVQRVRGTEYPNRFVPILMLTAKSELEDVKQARDIGVSEYLVKPFTVKALRDHIVEALENPRDFIVGDSYKGPDRRRKKQDFPKHMDRRRNK